MKTQHPCKPTGSGVLACCQEAVLCVPGVLRGFSCSVARNQPQRTQRTERRNANVSEQHTITPLPIHTDSCASEMEPGSY